MIHKLDDQVSVAPQIAPGELGELAEDGFAMVINNRPDHEEHGQPLASAICEAARAAGMDYVEIPVTPGGFTAEMVAAMADALAKAKGPVLAFCRSGTRSTSLWALAEASRGVSADALITKAAAAGYDLSGLRPTLETLAARA
ncbi:MAG: TIGR01244 family sulfur transferase [Sphingomonas sp.]